jgi:hypothetical protein
LFRFYTEKESFGVSIEPKITEEQPKQCDRKHILVFIYKNLGLFRFVSVCLKTESFNVSTEPKETETEDQLKQFDREHILVFFRKFRVLSVCCETVLFVLVVSI